MSHPIKTGTYNVGYLFRIIKYLKGFSQNTLSSMKNQFLSNVDISVKFPEGEKVYQFRKMEIIKGNNNDMQHCIGRLL